MTKHPEWALKHKRKGTELRLIKGHYYLYEVTSKWNPEKKRAQKITGKLLGKITPEGFFPSRRYTKYQKPLQSPAVREYGASHFFQQTMSDVSDKIKELFPSYWKEILGLSFIRLLHQSPIKNIDFHLKQSYLSVLYPDLSLNDKKVSSLLSTLGDVREKIVSFFKTYLASNGKDYMLMDATHLFSHSQNLDIAKIGYNNEEEFIPQLNLMFIYSSSLSLPVYYRILPGDIREVKGFKLTLQESGIEDAVLIADKGFYSESNIAQLEEEGLKYIIPLRRNSSLIDYTPLQRADKKGMHGYFKYKNRYIWYYSYEVKDKIVHLYLDENLKMKEQNDYLNRIETHSESYNLDEFHENQSKFGTLSMLTNLTGASAEEVYISYKSRNDIEVMIDTMKNVLKADHSYMRSQSSLEGWMFITFLALQAYYRIYKLLKEKNLLSKYSPQDLLMHLSGIKKVKINDEWYTSEINSKTTKLLEKLDLNIT